MAHGTWTTTGGAGITAGGVLAIAGGVAVLANLHAIERGAGELVAALAVGVLAFLVLAVAGVVLLGWYFRRDEARFAVHLAERRTVPAATLPAAPAPIARALPAAQPQVVHYHLHGDPRDWQLFPGHNGAGKSQITPGEEVPR